MSAGPAGYSHYETLPLPVVIASDAGIVYVNPALATLLGQTPEQLIGTSFQTAVERWVAPSDLPWLQSVRDAYVRGDVVPSEELHVRLFTATQGERTYAARLVTPVKDGVYTYVLIDAEPEGGSRVLADALLEATVSFVECRDEHRVLEIAVEAMHAQGFAVICLKFEGTQSLRVVGFRDVPQIMELLTSTFGAGASMELVFEQATFPNIHELRTNRRAKWHPSPNYLIPHPTGHPFERTLLELVGTHHVLEAPVFLDDAPYALFMLRGRNIRPSAAAVFEMFTRQVAAALENVRHHRRAAEQLERMKQLQQELVKRERLAALGEAAAAVSHEVRNPLGSILNGMAVLRRHVPDQRELFGMVEEEAHRIEELVTTLFELAHPMEPQRVSLVLDELVNAAMGRLQIRGANEGSRLSVIAHDGSGGAPLRADAGLVQRALEHLLHNAVQVSPPGGEVQVRIERDGQTMVLAVEDQGPGVEPEEEERIFEPFFTRRAKGSGLGLALVRRVAEAHGGAVRVTRAKLGGARFELRFPDHESPVS